MPGPVPGNPGARPICDLSEGECCHPHVLVVLSCRVCPWPMAPSPNCRGRGVWCASCADGKFSARRAWPGLALPGLPSVRAPEAGRPLSTSSQPIVPPWRRQPHHCWIEIGRLFQAPRHVRLRLGPVDPRCALLFWGWELGPARGDPPHLRWAEGGPPGCCSFPAPGARAFSRAQATTVAAIYTCHCCLR